MKNFLIKPEKNNIAKIHVQSHAKFSFLNGLVYCSLLSGYIKITAFPDAQIDLIKSQFHACETTLEWFISALQSSYLIIDKCIFTYPTITHHSKCYQLMLIEGRVSISDCLFGNGLDNNAHNTLSYSILEFGGVWLFLY